jgi:hypothetical protein
MKSQSTHMESNASSSYVIISPHISLQSCKCICDVIKVWVWPGTSANYEIVVTFSLLYMSCLLTLKLAFSFCEVQHLFHCLSFQIISTIHPASYPNGTRKSFLGTTIARGCIKPLTFSCCLGLECVGKFTPLSSQCYFGVVLMQRQLYISLL